jgi:hypothetical protein
MNRKTETCWNCHKPSEKVPAQYADAEYCVHCGANYDRYYVLGLILEFAGSKLAA